MWIRGYECFYQRKFVLKNVKRKYMVTREQICNEKKNYGNYFMVNEISREFYRKNSTIDRKT